MFLDPKQLNPKLRVFEHDDEAQIRAAFQDAGADLGDPWDWDSTAVDLNPIDMSYHGWVPSDIASKIDQGKITHDQIPPDFYHTAADDAWLAVHEAQQTQALG